MLFVKWFIRVRWISVCILIIATYLVKNVLNVDILEKNIYILAGVLILLNVTHTLLLKRTIQQSGDRVIRHLKWIIQFQIISDQIILTLVLHFAGGIENPLVILYLIHIILASSIFSSIKSYVHTAIALLMLGMLCVFECYGIIPHHHMHGFIEHEMYANKLFIFGVGGIYVFTSIILVGLTQMIITRSIKVEETYVKTNLLLQEKDKLQHQYVMRVTHDIKGHLAAILSRLSVVRAGTVGPLTEQQTTFVGRAYERTEILSNFVKDLLNLTRQRLHKETEFEDFDLNKLLLKVVTPIEVLAKDQSIVLDLQIEQNLPKMHGNPLTLRELYSNLLVNALKYTPEGGRITLSVSSTDTCILSKVSDTGIGIHPDDIPKVFDEFFRAGNAKEKNSGGSGLGLSIVDQIIKNHKGTIAVKSKVGSGTTFVFQLPQKQKLRKSKTHKLQ